MKFRDWLFGFIFMFYGVFISLSNYKNLWIYVFIGMIFGTFVSLLGEALTNRTKLLRWLIAKFARRCKKTCITCFYLPYDYFCTNCNDKYSNWRPK